MPRLVPLRSDTDNLDDVFEQFMHLDEMREGSDPRADDVGDRRRIEPESQGTEGWRRRRRREGEEEEPEEGEAINQVRRTRGLPRVPRKSGRNPGLRNPKPPRTRSIRTDVPPEALPEAIEAPTGSVEDVARNVDAYLAPIVDAFDNLVNAVCADGGEAMRAVLSANRDVLERAHSELRHMQAQMEFFDNHIPGHPY